jgi:hypothetical protein
MNTFYEFLATEFETQIADLRPTDAYVAIRQQAYNLAKYGFSSIPERLAIPITPITPGSRDSLLLNELQQAYGLYAQGVLQKAFEMARRVTDSAARQQDPLSRIDALHLQGRIHFDLERFSEADTCFAEEMDLCQGCAIVPGFVRAIHEASRVCSRRIEPLRAEFGFRFAWDYYTSSMILRGSGFDDDDSPGSDAQNIQAAIDCLLSLSELYTFLENGPKEADALIQRLASPHFLTSYETGDAFWGARALATLCLASFTNHQAILGRMASRALAWHHKYPHMSSFLLEEAEFVADLSGDPFPRIVRRVLARSM